MVSRASATLFGKVGTRFNGGTMDLMYLLNSHLPYSRKLMQLHLTISDPTISFRQRTTALLNCAWSSMMCPGATNYCSAPVSRHEMTSICHHISTVGDASKPGRLSHRYAPFLMLHNLRGKGHLQRASPSLCHHSFWETWCKEVGITCLLSRHIYDPCGQDVLLSEYVEYVGMALDLAGYSVRKVHGQHEYSTCEAH
ncbi:hypothetical protein DENSPDRAFT_646313 [Dentipellis sp. KUC8613]|nr:hypothetical protein DENSPDRAFT_646313 [Dentipellis sp. KUC8613]